MECSQCNDIKRDAKLLHRIHKYPRILVIQLKRFKAVLKVDESRRAKKMASSPDPNAKKDPNDYVMALINKKVEYQRYFTVQEGVQRNEVHYELIGLVSYSGKSLQEGHYVAYILNSDNKWYMLDDVLKENQEKQVSAYEALNQEMAYLFFYRKIDEKQQRIIDQEHIDLMVDTYGKDDHDRVAVALDLNVRSNGTGEPSTETLNIINQFKSSKCQNLEQFIKFINDNQDHQCKHGYSTPRSALRSGPERKSSIQDLNTIYLYLLPIQMTAFLIL